MASSAATWWWISSRSPAARLTRFVLAAPAIGGYGFREFSISPDGRKVAFVADRKLRVWDFSQLRPRELKGAGEVGAGEAGAAPMWSPDSSTLVYFGSGRLWRISAHDGSPSVICSVPGASVGGAWQPDDTIVFSTTRGPMYSVPAFGGEPKVLIPLAPGEVDFHQPIVLPNGKGLLYVVHGDKGTDTMEVFTAGQRKVIMRAPDRVRASPQILNLPAYSATGHIVYSLDEGTVGIWAVPFTLSNLETTGDPFLIVAGGRNPSVSDDGTLVYAPTADAAPAQLAWLRLDGTVEQTIGEFKQGLFGPAVSPDGKRIAYTAVENNNSDVWIHEMGGGSVRITATPINEGWPVWMPDGRTLAFNCPTDQGLAICTKSADASGDARVMVRNAARMIVSHDGKHIVFQSSGLADRGLRSWNMQPSEQPRSFVSGKFEVTPIGFSADGRYVAYSSLQSGHPRIYLKRFPSGEGQWEIPDLRSEFATWPRGGAEMFTVTGQGRELVASVVPVNTNDAPVFGRPKTLFRTTGDRLSLFWGFVASPDGKRLLTVQRQQSTDDVTGIVVVQNWWSEFRDRANRSR